jgi:hypothetical protein
MHKQELIGGLSSTSSYWSLHKSLLQRSPLREQPDQAITVAVAQRRVVRAPKVCLHASVLHETIPSPSDLGTADPLTFRPASRPRS